MDRFAESTVIKDMNLTNQRAGFKAHEGMAELDGTVTPRLCDDMKARAAACTGSVLTDPAYVCSEGQAFPRQMGIHSPVMIPGLYELAEVVHGENRKIVVPLSHAGAQVIGDFSSDMTGNDISQAAIAFGLAAERAKSAGCDGVQILCIPGELLTQFLSPNFNKREDRYGGSFENRSRFLLEVMGLIRSRVGCHFPVSVQVDSGYLLEQGVTGDQMAALSKMFDENGIDMVETSDASRLGEVA